MTSIPTIQTLYTQILSDLSNPTTGFSPIPVFGKIFLRALAMVQAVKLKLFYIALAGVQKNIFVDTADPEAQGGTLERFGRVKLKRDPFPAVSGVYNVTVTGSVGGVIPASTTFISNDDALSPGMLFILDTAHVMATGSDTVSLRALNQGTISKLSIGDKLTATSPLALVDSLATVSAETTQPIDAENIEEYRGKSVQAYQLEPQGGAPSDYRIWSYSVAGVKQVYPYAAVGNDINLFVESEPSSAIDLIATPSPTMLNAVKAAIETPSGGQAKKPLGVFQINYLPVSLKQVDINIVGYAGITPAIKDLILNSVKQWIGTIRPYVAGADAPQDKNDVLDINKVIAVILATQPGATFSTLSIEVDGFGLASKTFINGDIPFLNSITYS
ncbi:MAG TPA: baseplate J/gp47 family protein [Cyclobacteriaceae bacterium]|jgi:uncharacterized phage protein gp47/JayE|nr:baseplate J/gp47 family protein [Cyclobacteriaceae bacterium]